MNNRRAPARAIVSISVSTSPIIFTIQRHSSANTNKKHVSLKRIDKPGEIRSNDQPQNGHDKCRRAKQEFQFAPRTWPGCRLTKIPRFLHGSPSAWTNSRDQWNTYVISATSGVFYRPHAVHEWKFRGDFHLWSTSNWDLRCICDPTPHKLFVNTRREYLHVIN